MTTADAIRPELLGDLIAGIGALILCLGGATAARLWRHDKRDHEDH